jgi:hypothetical protein
MSDDPDFCPRRIAAENRLFKHGYIGWGFAPGVTLEQLERFADHLDAEEPAPEKWY